MVGNKSRLRFKLVHSLLFLFYGKGRSPSSSVQERFGILRFGIANIVAQVRDPKFL